MEFSNTSMMILSIKWEIFFPACSKDKTHFVIRRWILETVFNCCYCCWFCFIWFCLQLKYSWFIIFQVHNKVIQIHIYLIFIRLFSHIGYYEILGDTEYSSNRSLLLICSMHNGWYMLIPNFKFITPIPFHFVNHQFVFMSVNLCT